MEITHDVTDIEFRKREIQEIEGDENLSRKEESYRRSEIYKDRQEKYILQRLAGDLGLESARDMRTFTSINLTKKMVHELASIYRYEPDRNFTMLNQSQMDTMEGHYKYSKANQNYKKTNRMYKLHEQCALKIIPKEGFLKIDVLQPHHYDVIPNRIDPEVSEVYIISSFDKTRVKDNIITSASKDFEDRRFESDGHNQKIGDEDDWDLKNKIYYWWTPEYNFSTNEKGQVLDPVSMEPMDSVDFNQFKNPIGKVPFVDVSTDKDFEYWVRSGSSITEFNVDFGTIVSDNVNINRNQGFSQAVISSVESPKQIKIGPDKVIWLKVDKNGETATRPEFEFVTPNPDISGSLEMTRDLLKYFLVGKSINIKDMLEGKGNATSGLDHLLMMIEKFEASQDDIDLFKNVEQNAYELMVLWNNVFQSVTDGFNSKVKGVNVPEDSEVMVKFGGPSQILSDSEKLDFIERQIDLGLMTPVEALEEIREIDEETANKLYEEIKSFNRMDDSQLMDINKDIMDELPSDQKK